VKHRRFRIGRRDAQSISPEALEAVLGENITPRADDASFEDMVLGQVNAARPFLGAAQRKQVRWIRMSIIGMALGLFATGAIAVRAGLLPGADGPGVVSSMVDIAQSESRGQLETASSWRSEALAQLTAYKERHRSATRTAAPSPTRSAYFVSTRDSVRDSAAQPAAFLSVGLTMQYPSSPIAEANNTSSRHIIVFNDGLAISAGRSIVLGTNTAPCLVTRWPSSVQQSIEQIGLEGTGGCSFSGIMPPWYSSDVIGLPEIVNVRPHPDPINPH